MKAELVLTGFFMVLAAALLVPAASAIPVDFWGNVTINVSGVYNVTPDGANITAHINGSDSVNVSVKAGVGVYFGATTTTAPGMYLISVPCVSGDNISFRIYNVTALINNTWSGYPCGTAPNSTQLYLNITALQNGSFCTDNGACITGSCPRDYDGSGSWCAPSGYCVHDGSTYANGYALCQDLTTLQTCTTGGWVSTTCTACANGICTSIGSPSTPSSTPTTTETNVTNPTIISEIISGITPADLGLTTMTASDVTVKQIGSTAETTVQTTTTIADLAIQMATDDTAKAAIEAIKGQVAADNDVDVKVGLTVYKVESPSTGQSIYVSKVTLSFTAANDMKNVDIVQVIPKSMASSIAEVTFLSGTPSVLQSDPIVRWSFAEVGSGDTKDMSYTIKKQLSSTSDITTLAAAANITTPVTPTVTPPVTQPAGLDYTLWIIGIVVIIVIIIALFFFLRK